MFVKIPGFIISIVLSCTCIAPLKDREPQFGPNNIQIYDLISIRSRNLINKTSDGLKSLPVSNLRKFRGFASDMS